MEIQVTWGRAIRVWWAYAWRNLVAILVSAAIGAIIGFFMGIVLGYLGIPTKTIRYVTGPMGLIVGLAISIVPMKMILNKDFGEFRLVLLSK